MANLKYGSTGDEVKKLQESLGFTGADVDGIYGQKTESAVREYQQANNLSVDGIVGDETWGSLKSAAGGSASNSSASSGTASGANPGTATGQEKQNAGFSYEPYQKSDTVAQAEALLQQQLAQKPGAYNSTWQGQLNEILNRIMNREDFSYDLNEDAMYQQLKDQYVLLGQQGSMDVMGQAQAMTGGYGNSYAQTVGQQTYQGYLQQLNDQVPELYGMALDRYNQEGQSLYDQASLMAGMEEQEYGRYQDSLSAYYAELDRLTEEARYLGEQDYGKWADKLNLDYGMYRDQVADKQWQTEFDEAKRQYDQAYALETGTTGDTGGGGNPGGNYNEETAKRQQELRAAGYNVAVDGIWGPESKAAWEEYQAKKGPTGGTVLSSAAKNFMSKLPYVPAGGDTVAWKNLVDQRLENSSLSDDDKVAIMKELGLF